MTVTPGAAILWTMLVPGLAHVRLGRPGRALLAFATSTGLFWLGVAIVGPRAWYFQLFEPFALLKPVLERVPVQLLPEVPNLGCSIAYALLYGPASVGDGQPLFDWLRLIRVPVPHEHVGLLLTGASGVVAALWAADAHWLAQGRGLPSPSPMGAALLSWLVPGSGHWRLGQKDKGVLMGAAVAVMFGLGLWLSNGNAVDRPMFSAWWIGEVLFGGGAAFAALVTAPLEQGYPPRFIDHGVAMCTVAGFMNLVVMIDAYTLSEQRAGAPAGARA